MPTGIYERSSEEKNRLREMIKVVGNKANKGDRLSPQTEFRKGNVPWNKGIKWEAMSGENHPSRKPELKNKFEAQWENFKKNRFRGKGENHPRWKGGITPLIMKIRNSPQYAEWRNKVYQENKYTCLICGDNRGHNLNAHHKTFLSSIIHQEKIKSFNEALNCKKIWEIKNGVTLCESCHKLGNEISRVVEILN